jgi:hypothetical protein
MKSCPKIRDYVLATKYSDGDPCDAYAVGYLFRYAEIVIFLWMQIIKYFNIMDFAGVKGLVSELEVF